MKIRDYDKEIEREILIKKLYDILYEIREYFVVFWENLKLSFKSERQLLEHEPNLDPRVKKLQVKYVDNLDPLETKLTTKIFDFFDSLCAIFLASSPIWLTILFSG